MTKYDIEINNSDKIEIYRFVFEPVNSNMYIIFGGDNAIIIDPNQSEAALDLLKSNHTQKIYIFLTHEHFDHTSGACYYMERFDSEVICHEYCADKISIEKNNRPLLVAFVLNKKGNREDVKRLLSGYKPYKINASKVFDTKYEKKIGRHDITIYATPGHTPGSCCIELDKSVVFTGDSWIKDTPVITRFSGGNLEEYIIITQNYLNNLAPESVIMPGHGESFIKKDVPLII